MKKPSSKIREEIAKLNDQLRQAEMREAERIGRIALKAGLGDIEIDEADLHASFEDVAKRFRAGRGGSIGRDRVRTDSTSNTHDATVAPGTTSGNLGEV